MDTHSDYNSKAREYADQFADQLRHTPLDRALLDVFVGRVRGLGGVLDVGCGPGQVARYLHERGLATTGIDVSNSMVRVAKETAGGPIFRQDSLLELSEPECSWGGITAFYAVVHFNRKELRKAVREMFRVIKRGGCLLLAFHTGGDDDEFDVDVNFYELKFVKQLLTGFSLEVELERAPYPHFEAGTRRGYILACKPQV